MSRRDAPATSLRLLTGGDSFVAMGALQRALDRLTWAPIQLATRVGARPVSPRLPHALVLALALEAREQTGGVGAVKPDVVRLAAQVEATPELVVDAVRVLARAGVLVAAGESLAEGADEVRLPAVRIAPHLLGPAPHAATLDWRWIATATAGAPSAWVAAHAIAEWLDPGDEWVSIPRNLLQAALGAGLAGVRGALGSLVAASVLERREVAGRASHYRFGPRARGSGVIPFAESVVPAPRASAKPAPTMKLGPVRGHSPVGAAPAEGVEVTIGGATFDVGPGMRIALNAPGMVVSFDVGVDGRTRVSVAPPAASERDPERS